VFELKAEMNRGQTTLLLKSLAVKFVIDVLIYAFKDVATHWPPADNLQRQMATNITLAVQNFHINHCRH
jgi:hypothetical protein